MRLKFVERTSLSLFCFILNSLEKLFVDSLETFLDISEDSIENFLEGFHRKFLSLFSEKLSQKSDIVFSSIHESCTQRILGSLMNIVHIQLAEDILAMGVHGMET